MDDNTGDLSPEIKMKNIRKIETGTQRIVKRIGGHVYREFHVESLIAQEKKAQIYKDELESIGKHNKRRGSGVALKTHSALNLGFKHINI